MSQHKLSLTQIAVLSILKDGGRIFTYDDCEGAALVSNDGDDLPLRYTTFSFMEKHKLIGLIDHPALYVNRFGITKTGLQAITNNKYKKMIAILKRLYADLPPGTEGEVIKSWTDPNGCKWHRLFLGTNLSGQKLIANVPENCLVLAKPFKSSHNLDFEIAEWHTPGYTRFRVGTCEGLWSCNKTHYILVSVVNNVPGNGHLDDVFEWFENSCKRDKKKFMIAELMNDRFKQHLVAKRGFTDIGNNYLEK